MSVVWAGGVACGTNLLRMARSPEAIISFLRREFGSPWSWTVSQGTVQSITDRRDEITVRVLVTGPATGLCRLLSGAAPVAEAQVNLSSGESTMVVFRLRAVDEARKTFLSRAVP